MLEEVSRLENYIKELEQAVETYRTAATRGCVDTQLYASAELLYREIQRKK